MRLEARKLLEDVRRAADLATSFVSGRALADYEDDPLLRSAVERQLEIIGEAMRRLTKADAAVASQISYAPRIVSFRNVLAHGYDAVEDQIVWDIVETHLPPLLQQVRALLAEPDSPPTGEAPPDD